MVIWYYICIIAQNYTMSKEIEDVRMSVDLTPERREKLLLEAVKKKKKAKILAEELLNKAIDKL